MLIREFYLKYFRRRYFILITLWGVVGCVNNPLIAQVPQVSSDVQFLYIEFGGQDVYRVGMLYGKAIYILFSGESRYYNLYFKRKPILKKTGQIQKNQLDSLQHYFQAADFLNLPNVLPRPKNLFWPITYCRIGYRQSKTDSMKMVKAVLFQGKRYYPKGFLNLQSKLRALLFDQKQ